MRNPPPFFFEKKKCEQIIRQSEAIRIHPIFLKKKMYVCLLLEVIEPVARTAGDSRLEQSLILPNFSNNKGPTTVARYPMQESLRLCRKANNVRAADLLDRPVCIHHNIGALDLQVRVLETHSLSRSEAIVVLETSFACMRVKRG